MTNEEYYKHALSVYNQAVNEEGDQKQASLKRAKNILENLPDNWPGKSELMKRINYMLN